MRHGRESGLFYVRVKSFEWFVTQTSLTSAFGRYPLPGGGFAEGQVCWLDEMREGMDWRVRVFKSEADARAALRLLGASRFILRPRWKRSVVGGTPSFLYTVIAGEREPEVFTSEVDDELPLSSARWHVEGVDLAGSALFEGVEYKSRRLYCSTR